jgi:hypothetical protein
MQETSVWAKSLYSCLLIQPNLEFCLCLRLDSWSRGKSIDQNSRKPSLCLNFSPSNKSRYGSLSVSNPNSNPNRHMWIEEIHTKPVNIRSRYILPWSSDPDSSCQFWDAGKFSGTIRSPCQNWARISNGKDREMGNISERISLSCFVQNSKSIGCVFPELIQLFDCELSGLPPSQPIR